MEQMEPRLRLEPRYQVLLDLAQHMPDLDTASIRRYLFFLWVASNMFAAQQAFFDRFDLSEGKTACPLLTRHICWAKSSSQCSSRRRFWLVSGQSSICPSRFV